MTDAIGIDCGSYKTAKFSKHFENMSYADKLTGHTGYS